MVVASGEEGLARGRAERGGVEAIELEAFGGKHLRCGRAAWAAEGAGGAEAGVVDQDDQNVGCASGWAQRVDWRVFVFGVFCVVEDQAFARLVRNWEYCPLNVVLNAHDKDFLLVRNLDVRVVAQR